MDQRLWNGRALLGITFYDNNFYDLISFLSTGELISIGVLPDVANSTPMGGAYVNATLQWAKGAEVDYKMDLGHGFLFQGEYTYADALVTKAFGVPSINPLFPDIPIGAFSPLEGARPFRIAPHSGSLALSYNHKKLMACLRDIWSGVETTVHFFPIRFLVTPCFCQIGISLPRIRNST